MFKLFLEFGVMVCVFLLGAAFGAEVVSRNPETPEEKPAHSVTMPLDRKYREYGGGR